MNSVGHFVMQGISFFVRRHHV